MAAGDPDYTVLVDALSFARGEHRRETHDVWPWTWSRLAWLIGADGRGISPVEDLGCHLPD